MTRPELNSAVKDALQQYSKAAAEDQPPGLSVGAAAGAAKAEAAAGCSLDIECKGSAAAGEAPPAAAGEAPPAAAAEGSGRAAAALLRKWEGKVTVAGLVETGKWLRGEQGAADDTGAAQEPTAGLSAAAGPRAEVSAAAAAAGGSAQQLYQAPGEDQVVLVLLMLGPPMMGEVSYLQHNADMLWVRLQTTAAAGG